MPYNRNRAVQYAHKWAYRRNPRFADFSKMGGDCTNFVSQCLNAGGAGMDYSGLFGWYYRSLDDRAPAWSGVKYLYNYLMRGSHKGLHAREIGLEEIQPGDVIQLSFDGYVFSHSLIVVRVGRNPSPRNVLVATHTQDTDRRALSSYPMQLMRCLSISVD